MTKILPFLAKFNSSVTFVFKKRGRRSVCGGQSYAAFVSILGPNTGLRQKDFRRCRGNSCAALFKEERKMKA